MLVAGGKVGVMGKRWNNPDFLAGRVVAIGKRTMRRTQWLSRVTADPDLAT